MRMVKGLRREVAERILAARHHGPFHCGNTLVKRASLHRHELMPLAAAGALASLVGHRHQAYWLTMGIEASLPLFSKAMPRDIPVTLPVPGRQQELQADYASTGLSLGPHPLLLLRRMLPSMRRASELFTLPDQSPVSAVGLVVCRQRPYTASGVVFLTLEDETGAFNVIVWRHQADSYRRIVMCARLIAVHGYVQREGAVLHIVARHLEDHSIRLGSLALPSRDFC